jgi:hypothetical protein
MSTSLILHMSRRAGAAADWQTLVGQAAELHACSAEVHLHSAEVRRHSAEVIRSSRALVEDAHALRARSTTALPRLVACRRR